MFAPKICHADKQEVKFAQVKKIQMKNYSLS